MPAHSPATILEAFARAGIACQEHQLGLARYCRDPAEYAAALIACGQPTTLHPAPAPSKPHCREDAMVCTCPEHAADREQALTRRRRDVRQPWEPRRAAA